MLDNVTHKELIEKGFEKDSKYDVLEGNCPPVLRLDRSDGVHVLAKKVNGTEYEITFGRDIKGRTYSEEEPKNWSKVKGDTAKSFVARLGRF